MSCPPLRRNLFTAADLDEELDEVQLAGIFFSRIGYYGSAAHRFIFFITFAAKR